MNSNATIYLIDDDSSARKGLSRLLSVAGYDVEAFSSLDKFSQTHAINNGSCLIVDARLPGLLGTTLQTLMADKKVSVPVIFLSARDDEPSRNIAREADAAGFFRKPIDGPALLDAIAWVIDRQGHEGL